MAREEKTIYVYDAFSGDTRLCQENCVSLYNKLHKALHYITAVPGPFPEQPFFDGNDVKR